MIVTNASHDFHRSIENGSQDQGVFVTFQETS
jgi:hypothetical protein